MIELAKPPKEFQTARLLMRPPEMSDAEAIFERYAQDEQVTKYVVWSPHPTIETTREFILRCVLAWEDVFDQQGAVSSAVALPKLNTVDSNSIFGAEEERAVHVGQPPEV